MVPGRQRPRSCGSAKEALDSTSTDPNAPEYASIRELLRVVDEYIPEPKRETDKPFMMAVEDVLDQGTRHGGDGTCGSWARQERRPGLEIGGCETRIR